MISEMKTLYHTHTHTERERERERQRDREKEREREREKRGERRERERERERETERTSNETNLVIELLQNETRDSTVITVHVQGRGHEKKTPCVERVFVDEWQQHHPDKNCSEVHL